ncbi:type VI secretion system lipoprotein TssJ [Xenorhabdus nematophila]|nr:type VI secretion system lipoprotein TssJ [Xenorhabdus nematophila]
MMTPQRLAQRTKTAIDGLPSIGRLLPGIFLLTLLITVTGCSSQEKTPPPYKIIFDIAAKVNDSAPLKMHVILLKSGEEFMSADFFSLREKAQNVLDDKLINEDPFFIRPAQTVYCLSEKNQPDANYIGIIAEYNQLNGKKWRLLFPVPTAEKPAFYEFWRSSPDELPVCVKVTHNGLSFTKECHLSCPAGAEEKP